MQDAMAPEPAKKQGRRYRGLVLGLDRQGAGRQLRDDGRRRRHERFGGGDAFQGRRRVYREAT